MKILKMRATFGKLQSAELALGEGLNVIEAPNEGGKSTWSAFLRAMLYGINTKERDRQGYLAEKNRYQPWSGAAMEGSVELLWQGRSVTLRRGPKGSTPFGRFEAVYTGTAELVPGLTGDNAGETLTGVPREVFERSAFVGQGGAAIDGAPALEARIAALASSGEEDVSYSQVERRLRDWLNRRKHNKTGLIPRLDQYIWEAVCQMLQKWQASGSNLVPVSVNVSVVDIVNLDVPQIFSDLVEKYQLEPKLLLAEITETMLAENSSVVENAIQGLHRKGFSVMMDDFGSGYSSLNMLKDTNVDAIKLDMKLIDMNQQNHSKGVQIVESVINMAHRLNLPIIAEGVETPEQVSMLQAADCLYTQGYYFFKPMPIENAEKLLAQPNNADYWDMRRDLMRRDHRTAAEDPDSEKTALALQAYQIFTDNLLEVSLLNLVTGTYRVIKRDARLPSADLAKEEDFTTFCDRLVNEKVVHPDDAEMFQEQVDLPLLQDTLFHSQQPEFYRFRKQVANQFVWITMEVLPCRGCCAQNPWATVLMREDAQANQLSEELDFSYSHDTLTGLANRSKYESDLRELQYSDYDSMVCTYIDVVGLHEVNDHLGHRSGDNLLCTIANAARKFFVSSRIYRVGGDEFVVLTPNLPPYDVWTASDRMRVFLREKDCEISVGIQNTNNLRKLEAAVNKAEQAMQQDKLAYYSRNGQERQLKGLNEKLERTLTQKRDAEHFLRVLAPKYRSVYVVNLQDDSVRPIILPDFFQKILDTSGGSFRAVITAYRDQYVMPESRDAFNSVLDYSFVRSKVLSGEIVEVHYTRTDGAPYTLKITPYSSSGSHIHETIWIFADDTATLTPPPRKLKNNRNNVK